MESGSGSGFGSESGFGSGSGNGTTIPFSCTMNDLDPANVTNDTAWQLTDTNLAVNIVFALIEVVIFLVALVWNIFIVLTYIVKRELLREQANIFLIVLSIVDIIICVVLMPLSIVVVAAGDYILGSSDQIRCGICFMQGFFIIFLSLLSLHILAILSIDRFLLLSQPLKYRSYFHSKKPWVAMMALAAAVLLCFFVAIPPAFGFGEWEFNTRLGVCLPRWTPASNQYYSGLIVLEALIPIITLGVTNTLTFRIVAKFLKQRVKRQRSFRSSSDQKREDSRKHNRQQRQLVKVFTALFVANTIVWTPVIIAFAAVVITRGVGIPYYVFIIGWICYLLNPMIHPILESFFIKELRYQVRRARTSVRKNVSKASSFIKQATRSSMKELPEVDDSMIKDQTPCKNTNMEMEELANAADTPTLHGRVSVVIDPVNITPILSKKRRTGAGAPSYPLVKQTTTPDMTPPTMIPSNNHTSHSQLPDSHSPKKIPQSLPKEFIYTDGEKPLSPVAMVSFVYRSQSVHDRPTYDSPTKPRHISITLPDGTVHHKKDTSIAQSPSSEYSIPDEYDEDVFSDDEMNDTKNDTISTLHEGTEDSPDDSILGTIIDTRPEGTVNHCIINTESIKCDNDQPSSPETSTPEYTSNDLKSQQRDSDDSTYSV